VPVLAASNRRNGRRVDAPPAKRSSILTSTTAATPTSWCAATLLEQNNEWAVQRAPYMTLETIAPLRDDRALLLPVAAA
jgi:hypothetical protein